MTTRQEMVETMARKVATGRCPAEPAAVTALISEHTQPGRDPLGALRSRPAWVAEADRCEAAGTLGRLVADVLRAARRM